MRRGESENCMEEKSCSSRPHTSLQTNETEKEGGDQKSESYQSCDRKPNFVKAKGKVHREGRFDPAGGLAKSWPNTLSSGGEGDGDGDDRGEGRGVPVAKGQKRLFRQGREE